jgi:hypothetical protein
MRSDGTTEVVPFPSVPEWVFRQLLKTEAAVDCEDLSSNKLGGGGEE